MNAFVNEAFALFLVIRKKVRVHTMCYLAEKIVPNTAALLCCFCTQIHADTTQMLRHVFDITQMGLGRETIALLSTYKQYLLHASAFTLLHAKQLRPPPGTIFSFCPEYVMTIYGDTSKYCTQVCSGGVTILICFLIKYWSCQKTCPWGMNVSCFLI